MTTASLHTAPTAAQTAAPQIQLSLLAPEPLAPQALAQGGGPNARGSEKRLRLHRKLANGTVQQIEPQLTDAVQANDVLYVKESIF